jgi:hypothetical protein
MSQIEELIEKATDHVNDLQERWDEGSAGYWEKHGRSPLDDYDGNPKNATGPGAKSWRALCEADDHLKKLKARRSALLDLAEKAGETPDYVKKSLGHFLKLARRFRRHHHIDS